MALLLPEPEVCPNCGSYCAELNESTGWCFECSPPRCEKCGGERTSNNKYCIACQRENWLERNANRLEELLAQGMTFSEAEKKIKKENRAVCIVCGSEIPGRHKIDTLFCTKKEECKKTRWRYINHLREGRSPSDALLIALRES